jgi:Mn2+/Fe2+ NRAMP family transporter
VPLITLVLFSGSRTIMGTLANSPVVNALAIGGSVIALSINVLLLLSLLLPA